MSAASRVRQFLDTVKAQPIQHFAVSFSDGSRLDLRDVETMLDRPAAKVETETEVTYHTQGHRIIPNGRPEWESLGRDDEHGTRTYFWAGHADQKYFDDVRQVKRTVITTTIFEVLS